MPSRWIHVNLEKLGIECIPDFEQVFMDSTVELRKKPTIKVQKSSDGMASKIIRDPIPRLALLQIVSQKPSQGMRI
jgi:hypothetical protein